MGGAVTGRISLGAQNHSSAGFLPGAFGAGGDLVFVRLAFAVALADLLFDFFGHQVNRRVKVAFDVLRQTDPGRARRGAWSN